MRSSHLALVAAAACFLASCEPPHQSVPSPPPTQGRHTGRRGGQQDAAAVLAGQMLGNLNATWRDILGSRYSEPRLVLVIRDQAGPHYDPDTRAVTYPVSFAAKIRQHSNCRGTNCDFAQLQITAHEVGHHIQQITGRLNGASPGVELQADCFSGVSLRRLDQRLQRAGKPSLIDPGDIETAQRLAMAFGDQSHGSGPQRKAAFNRGWQSGEMSACTGGGGGRFA
jgi:uncharacterized protein